MSRFLLVSWSVFLVPYGIFNTTSELPEVSTHNSTNSLWKSHKRAFLGNITNIWKLWSCILKGHTAYHDCVAYLHYQKKMSCLSAPFVQLYSETMNGKPDCNPEIVKFRGFEYISRILRKASLFIKPNEVADFSLILWTKEIS